MGFMRYTAGYTKWDYKRNDDVLKELRLEPVIKYIQEYQNKWMNHLRRMSSDRIPKAMIPYCPTGKRSLGCPRKRLIQNSSVRSQQGSRPKTCTDEGEDNNGGEE